MLVLASIVMTVFAVVPLGTAQASTPVNGIIKADTTWTKANSPYTLTGPVAINIGKTLTIELGVQVVFNHYYLQVNGTLIAEGSSFTGPGEIVFMPSSQGWNENTGTGSIIDHGNFPGYDFKLTINGGSPKISLSYSIGKITINGGSPWLDSNNLSGSATSLIVNGGTPIISNNKILALPIIVNNGSPSIINNSITSQTVKCIDVTGGNPLIANNEIDNSGNLAIHSIGISAVCGTIERNYIHNGEIGIEIGNGTVRNNTITCSTNILVLTSSKPMINFNNFEYGYVQNTKNVFLDTGANEDVNATFNWWGTTDETIISQSVIDNKNDFNLGTVNYKPFLTAPNSEAMPDSSVPASPSPTPTPSANPSPSIPEFPSTLILTITVILSSATVLIYAKIRRKTTHECF